MKFRVEDTKKKEQVLFEASPASHYPALTELEAAGEASFTLPITVSATARWEYDHVRVTGRMESRVRLSCARCLTEYESDISSDFTIFYTKGENYPTDEEVELTEEELVSVPYEGDEIDMDPEISEQVMMEVPYKPLCSERCKGLCPNCGADLNREECGCDRGGINLKMSALKDLKIDKKKGE